MIASIVALAIPLLSPSPVHAALTSHAPIYINGNSGFTKPDPVNGGGSGTENDPYIIENWDISAENANGIWVENTTAYFTIRSCYTHGGAAYRHGIHLDNVKNGRIDNNLVENNYAGILLESSDNIKMRSNTLSNNRLNFNVYGTTLSHFVHDIDASNIVNGKPIRYLVDNKNGIIGPSLDTGYLALVNCENIQVENLALENNGQGALLAFSENIRVENCNFENNSQGIWLLNSDNSLLMNNNMSNNYPGYGIIIISGLSNTMENNRVENNYYGIDLWDSSSNNRIANNCVSGNGASGICLVDSLNNTIVNNNSLNNCWDGICLYTSSNNVVENNRVENNGCGIDIYGFDVYSPSSNNLMINNYVENNYWGIGVYLSPNNVIANNNVSNNYLGICLMDSSDNNCICHNNFESNSTQARDLCSNYWDNGYPSGGNYWSDYTGEDNYRGENQDIPGGDSIGDTPYAIPGDNNRDCYPLMSPVGLRTEIITIYPIADVYAFGRYSRPQLRFNLNSIPAGAGIISVKLWLYRLAADNWDGNVTVYRVDNQLWDEAVTPDEFDAQILTNGETQSNKFMIHGWDYLNVLNQVKVDYEASNTYASLRLRWANDNGSEPSIGVDDGRFLAIESGFDNLEVVFYSSEYNGRDPYLEVVYVPPHAVSVSISPTYNSGAPTEVLSYTVTVKNTGNLDDNYILTASDNTGWGPTVSPTPLFVASGSAGEATLTVTVPENAKFCTMDNITVTATSQSDNTVSDNAWCLAHAAMVRGVEISISPSCQSGLPGENLEYTMTVRNLGNVDDDYDFIAQDTENWGLSIASSIMVPAFENRTTVLTVAIPDNVMGCTLDNVTVIATSQENENVSDSESCLAHVKVLPGVDVRIEPGWQENFFGENLTYTVTVINTGNARDNYILTADDIGGWGLTFSDNLVNDNRIDNLPPGENRTVTLTVTILDSAEYCKEDDIITVTATSMENTKISDNSSCIGHGISWTGWATFRLENLYKVSLEKDLQLYAGRKLVVKFYKYDNVTFQTESVIHNFTPRENIKENENIPHPRGAERFPWGTVQIARLVLTTDNTKNVISTIASFTVHQSHLRDRDKAILIAWGGHPELHDTFRAEEKDILIQWGSAPP